MASDLKLSVTSSNTVLVPKANLLFGGTGASRTLKATAVSGKSGTALLTVTVGDGLSTKSVPVSVKAGGNGSDAINGTSGSDMLFGQQANDALKGLEANDLLCAGSGKDTLSGAAVMIR